MPCGLSRSSEHLIETDLVDGLKVILHAASQYYIGVNGLSERREKPVAPLIVIEGGGRRSSRKVPLQSE